MKTFNRVFVLWCFMAVLIFGGLITLGYIYKSKVKSYEEYENRLEIAAKEFIEINNIHLNDQKKIKININKIIKSGLIDDEDIIKDCKGNIIVRNGSVIKYKADIKCKNYHSKRI